LEAIISNLENDGSDWSKQQIKILGQMSPTTLKMVFVQFQLSSPKSLKECLEMEYQIMLRTWRRHDTLEGIRALLVDKDNRPNWKPESIAKVDDALIDWYFKPQPTDDKLILPH
jgi:enoyl-CoA hydratase/carnithine racemase